jgi:hypothetical protein
LEKKLSRERGVLQNLQECVLLFFWGKKFFPNYSVNKNVLQQCSAKMVYRNVQQKWSTKMFFFAGGLLLYNYFIEEFDMTDSNQFYLNKIK